MKKLFLSLALLFFAVILYAQDKKDLKKAFVSAGVQTSLATGDYKDTHGWGVGANILGGYQVTNRISLTARVSYTRLFGKKYSYSYYEPGGGGSHSGHHGGMNDFGFTGGGRVLFNDHFYGGLEGGLCIDASDGHSESGGLGIAEIGYLFHCRMTPLEQAIAMFFGVCGDPKLQIGIRYNLRF